MSCTWRLKACFSAWLFLLFCAENLVYACSDDMIISQFASEASNMSRKSFPAGFVFGAATSAYQIEGGVNQDGRGKSIWDTFAHRFGNIIDRTNGDITNDNYNRYQDDVELIANMSADAYRFSISWSRIFPSSDCSINFAGIKHYNDLINVLLLKGIQPYVTLYHWDLPQALQDAYGGWLSNKIMFLDPLIFGDYPPSMRQIVGDRLPSFLGINNNGIVVKNSFDFIGLNHYTTNYVHAHSPSYIRAAFHNINPEGHFDVLYVQNGEPIGPQSRGATWLYVVPWGFKKILDYIRIHYHNPTIIVTENGYADLNESPLACLNHVLQDDKRIFYHEAYLSNLLLAIKDGSNVKGYFIWSLLDNWEWGLGLIPRFGVYFVDYKNNLTRYPKKSVAWFTSFLES